jgi:hypothetical protein
MAFNFSREALAAKLPEVGAQPAQVIDISVSSGDTTWMKLAFKLESGQLIEIFTAIDAVETSPHLNKIGEGIAVIEQMCAATQVDISTLTDPNSILAAFMGKRVQVVVAHKTSKGAPTAVVKAVTALPAGQ